MSIRLTINGATHEVAIGRRRPHLLLRIDGQDHEVRQLPALGDGHHTMTIGGQAVSFARAALGDRQIIRLGGRTYDLVQTNPFSNAGSTGGGQNTLRAPMPGAVVSVHRRTGETVRRGEALVTIESMKLQTALPSPRDGVIAEILRAEGETFEKDEIIVMLEPENAAS